MWERSQTTGSHVVQGKDPAAVGSVLWIYSSFKLLWACLNEEDTAQVSDEKEGLAYEDEVLSSDLVENHLADVLWIVKRKRQRNFCPLIVSTHQQVGFIWIKWKNISG